MEKRGNRPPQKNNTSKTAVRVGKGNGCPYFKKCGGCHLQNMTYEEQLRFKQIKAIKLLGRFCRVKEIICSFLRYCAGAECVLYDSCCAE